MAEMKGPKGGSITQTADAQNERIQGISNVAKTVDAMTKENQVKMERIQSQIKEDANIQEVSSSMNSVLEKLNQTISNFGQGVKNITMNTAKATQDAVSQYSKAIGEDISFNKRNIVAMSLARATPLFGYFAAKFMETDVFRNAAAKMREKVGNLVGGVFSKFRGRKGAETEEIPKMQKGGYVKRGGMAEVHAGEVVAPVEKILQRVDEQQKQQGGILKAMRRYGMQVYGFKGRTVGMGGAKEDQKRAKTWIGSFVNAWREAQEEEELPMQERQLRTLIAIQDALGAEYDTKEQIWNKFILENPTFRALWLASKAVSNVLGGIGRLAYALVKSRGGYKAFLSKSRNPMVAMNENIGQLYVGSMIRMDRIQMYTRATAQATRDISTMLTGTTYGPLPDVTEGRWNILGGIFKGLSFLPKWLFKGAFGATGWLTKAMGLQKTGQVFDWLGNFTKGVFSTPENIMDWFAKTSEQREFEKMTKEGYAKKGFLGIRSKETLTGPNIIDQLQKTLPLLQQDLIMERNYKKIMQKYSAKELEVDQKQLETQKESRFALRRIRKGIQARGIWQMLMSLFGVVSGFARQILGFLSGFGKNLGMWALSGIRTVFPGLLAGLSKLLPMLANPTVLAGAVAGALGYAIGSFIEKKFLSPLREKFFRKREAERAKAGIAERPFRKRMEELRKKKFAGTLTDVEQREYKRLVGVEQGFRGADVAKLRERKIGTFRNMWESLTGDQDLFNIVTSAQMGYASENYSRYAMYSPDTIKFYRQKWLESTKGVRGDPELYRKDPIEAGRRREEMFLQYLEKNAPYDYTPMTEGTTTERLTRKAKGEFDAAKRKAKTKIAAGKKVAAAATEKVLTDVVDPASLKADEAMVYAASKSIDLQNEVGRLIKSNEMLNQNYEKLAATVQNVSTTVQNNVSTVTNSPAGQAARQMGEYAHGFWVDKLTKGAIE